MRQTSVSTRGGGGREGAPTAPAEEWRPAAGLLEKLQCPECREGGLDREPPDHLRCRECRRRFPVVDEVPYLFESEMLARLGEGPGSTPKVVEARPSRAGGRYHWEEYRIRDLLPPAERCPEVLLLGCGDGGEKPILAELGFRPVGFDIRRSPATEFLGDAHRIPLRNATFDVVLSMQLLEHLEAPWTAVDEAARVLRPGGCFVGSVAFLKPFHQSFFHMSHEGVRALLTRAGLRVDRLSGAQSLTYALYGSLIPVGTTVLRRRLFGAVDAVLRNLRGRYWALTRRCDPDEPTDRFHVGIPMSFRDFDRLRFAPAVVFRAWKPRHPATTAE